MVCKKEHPECDGCHSDPTARTHKGPIFALICTNIKGKLDSTKFSCTNVTYELLSEHFSSVKCACKSVSL